MNKVWLLIKTNFINSYAINKLFKKSNKKTSLALLFVAIIGLLIFALFFIYMYSYGIIFRDYGKPQNILLLGIYLGSIVVIISSVTKVNGYLFKSRDFDMLLSMPLKTSDIVKSKLITLIIFTYLLFAYFYIPASVVYVIFNNCDILSYILLALGFFTIPLFPLFFFGFISYLFGMIKINGNLKKVLSIIIPVAFCALIFSISISSSSNSEDISYFFESMFRMLKKCYYLGYMAFLGMTSNIIQFIIVVNLSLISGTIFIFFVSKNFLKVNENREINTNKSIKMKEVKKSSSQMALLVKEIRNYFSLPIYVVNTIIGPVLSVILLLLLLSKSSTYDQVQITETLIINMREFLPPLVIIMEVFSFSMNSITSSSISLEGKCMWIVKTTPVKETKIFGAKIILNLLIYIPFILIDLVIANIYIKLSFLENIFILLIPISSILVTVIFGLYINLLFPKITFDNPIKVIKQSISTLLSIVFGFAFSLLMLIVGIIGIIFINKITITYLLVLMCSLIILFIISIKLIKKGPKLLRNIEC